PWAPIPPSLGLLRQKTDPSPSSFWVPSRSQVIVFSPCPTGYCRGGKCHDAALQAMADALGWADAVSYVALHFVTLVRPSTPTGAAPLMVDRRTTRFWSP